jgi:hypothetical protein
MLRKELAEATARSGRSSPSMSDGILTFPSDDDISNFGGSPVVVPEPLPAQSIIDVTSNHTESKKDQ